MDGTCETIREAKDAVLEAPADLGGADPQAKETEYADARQTWYVSWTQHRTIYVWPLTR